MTPEENISSLLRLKRHERPPEGYFNDFLQEFQSRQRRDWVRLSLWEIFVEKMSSQMPSFSIPRFAYTSLTAVAVFMMLVALGYPVLESRGKVKDLPLLTLTTPPIAIESSRLVTVASSSHSVHYVLPPRPVSYAFTRSF